MWIENQVFKEDLEYIINVDFVDWKKLEKKTVLVTGGTGLIGYYFINALLFRNLILQSNIKVIALVRNLDKAKDMYKKQLETECNLKFVVGDVEELPIIEDEIDFVMHGASPTASNFFVEHPVETIKTAVYGTINMLELAKKKQVRGFVYLSSMEVYGAIRKEEKICELNECYINTMLVRSSYPESKRICENLCVAYCSEYGVPINVLRLTQTIGPGIAINDKRVFAQFVNAYKKKQDIVLFTSGNTKRSYLYSADAVTAILSVMVTETKGDAYNVANEQSFCSIREMAELVACDISRNEIGVVFQTGNDDEIKTFMTEMYMDLDTSKLRANGWKPVTTLKEMFERTIR